MLAAGGYTGMMQAINQRASELNDNLRVAVKGTVANHAAVPPVEIEHRRAGQINAAGAVSYAQLGVYKRQS